MVQVEHAIEDAADPTPGAAVDLEADPFSLEDLLEDAMGHEDEELLIDDPDLGTGVCGRSAEDLARSAALLRDESFAEKFDAIISKYGDVEHAGEEREVDDMCDAVVALELEREDEEDKAAPFLLLLIERYTR